MILKISVAGGVVSGEIIFYVVSKISVVSVATGEVIFYAVSKFRTVSVVTGEIIISM